MSRVNLVELPVQFCQKNSISICHQDDSDKCHSRSATKNVYQSKHSVVGIYSVCAQLRIAVTFLTSWSMSSKRAFDRWLFSFRFGTFQSSRRRCLPCARSACVPESRHRATAYRNLAQQVNSIGQNSAPCQRGLFMILQRRRYLCEKQVSQKRQKRCSQCTAKTRVH